VSINIDKKLLRVAIGWAEYASALPISLPNYYPASFTWSYDGEWITIQTLQALYPAIRTCVAYESGSLTTSVLHACVNIKAPTNATRIYYFFYEPQKGDYANYQGLDTRDGAAYNARSRNGGVETKTVLADQDWTVERKMALSHQKDQSDMHFYIDGAEVAHHTTNISAQPFEICCAEPNGQLRTIYVRYPKGIYVDKV